VWSHPGSQPEEGYLTIGLLGVPTVAGRQLHYPVPHGLSLGAREQLDIDRNLIPVGFDCGLARIPSEVVCPTRCRADPPLEPTITQEPGRVSSGNEPNTDFRLLPVRAPTVPRRIRGRPCTFAPRRNIALSIHFNAPRRGRTNPGISPPRVPRGGDSKSGLLAMAKSSDRSRRLRGRRAAREHAEPISSWGQVGRRLQPTSPLWTTADPASQQSLGWRLHVEYL
jgi:hypothetical protein